MQNEILWTAGFFNERFPAPISPLAWSVLGPLIEDIALRDPLRYVGYPAAETIALTRLWQGHPYSNVQAFQIFYKVFPDFLLPEDAYRYFPDGAVGLRKQAPYPSSLFSPRFIISILCAFLSDPLNFSPWHNYRNWERYTLQHDRRVAALRAQLDTLKQAEPQQIFHALAEADRAHRDLLRIHRWSLMHADLTFGLVKRLTRRWIDRPRGDEVAAQIVRNVSNKTMEVDAALHQLAALARDVLPQVATWGEFIQRASPAANEAFKAFLAEHGHRSFSLDIALPTFADDPNQVLRLLQMMEGAQQNGQGEERAPSAAAPRSFGQRWMFSAIQDLAVRYVALRENQRYYWQKSLAITRRLYVLLGDRLVAQGILSRPDEVFDATHQELVDYFSGRLSQTALTQSVAERRGEWETYRREFERSPATEYPAFLRGDQPLVSSEPKLLEWRGRAVSPGTARGAARVVQSPNELSLIRHGEILVAPSTDPAWTPVFGKIAGLIMERGGVLSHGAVVAREYHVPAVAGIANIAQEIRDGEIIEVDGNAGLVTRIRK